MVLTIVTPVPAAALVMVTVNGDGPSPAPETLLIDCCVHGVVVPRLPVAVPHVWEVKAGAKSVPLISANTPMSPYWQPVGKIWPLPGTALLKTWNDESAAILSFSGSPSIVTIRGAAAACANNDAGSNAMAAKKTIRENDPVRRTI